MSEHEAINRWGFTGSRLLMTEAQAAAVRGLLDIDDPAELHHGDCVGADAHAHLIAQDLGMRVVGHPPDNDRNRAFCAGFAEQREVLPYLVRNRCIVDETEALIACPDGPERTKSGTWATVRYARYIGRPIYIVDPDGGVTYEPKTQDD